MCLWPGEAATPMSCSWCQASKYCPAVLRDDFFQLNALMKRRTHLMSKSSGQRFGMDNKAFFVNLLLTPAARNSSITFWLCSSACWMTSGKPYHTLAMRRTVTTSNIQSESASVFSAILYPWKNHFLIYMCVCVCVHNRLFLFWHMALSCVALPLEPKS